MSYQFLLDMATMDEAVRVSEARLLAKLFAAELSTIMAQMLAR